MAIVEIRADLAPMPAMRRAVELIMSGPVTEDQAEAVQILRRAYPQAELAVAHAPPERRDQVRVLLGDGVE